ncbi:hypothetical protein ASF61_16795 [Duganella sp. Leaf126]|uniref:HK97 gp10 family phage protein n=1 Tax=Duganella sp. Leaf126 TaxID=1736266 RepID=UPI0006FD4191|nr:HK97 gp10 family phage protein [Duganella sp. Leaf126]KQQ31992.1 hypothetical protein ASF61_16795 [Duganella sp. Leaf126]
MSMIRVDLSGLRARLAGLEEAAEVAARPAAQAAAQVYYDRMVRNVERIGRQTGNLRSALYQVYSQDHSGPGRAMYHISWNHRKAPHGHLVEFGHIQRYKVYVGSDGNWYTAIRPEMRGKRVPKRGASQAVKDAYYVPLATPKHVAAQPFVRSAAAAAPLATAAAEARLRELIR